MSRRFLFLLICAFPCIAFAQYRTGLPRPEPALVTVREFCRLDFMGGRLTPEGWARMKPLTDWKDNPTWHQVRVVSRYEQTGESDGFHSARITVKYLVLGTFESGIGFTPSSGSESYEFKLKETDGVWHIESTDPDQFDPHISKPRVIQWLQEKLKTTTDAGEKISIDTALKQLLPTAK